MGQVGAATQRVAAAATRQPSQLLPALFRDVTEGQRLSVLHIGPAFQDTVEFFSAYRCRLQVIDLFSELPLPGADEGAAAQYARLAELMQLDAGTRFDLCLFWNLFDYLEPAALTALMTLLRPCLRPDTLAHAVVMHSPNSPASPYLYGIQGIDALSLRPRRANLPGYAPHAQNRLRELLHAFSLERSVLMADRRLELLLRAKPAAHR